MALFPNGLTRLCELLKRSSFCHTLKRQLCSLKVQSFGSNVCATQKKTLHNHSSSVHKNSYLFSTWRGERTNSTIGNENYNRLIKRDRRCTGHPALDSIRVNHSARTLSAEVLSSSRSFHGVTCNTCEDSHLWKERSRHVGLLKCSSRQTPSLSQQVRGKSKKKRVVESDDESGSDEDDNLEEDDFDAPEKFKVSKIHTASLRADAVISAALQVSRQRLEEVFFGPGLLLNGEKMMKKSVKMDEGDYVDLVMEKTDGQYKVKRVKIIRVYPDKTTTGKALVKVRVWKAPFFIAAPSDRPS